MKYEWPTKLPSPNYSYCMTPREYLFSDFDIEKINFVFLDIYGTVLCSNDFDNSAPLREGTISFFEEAKKRRIKVVSTSDASNESVAMNFQEVAENHPSGFDISWFYHRMRVPGLPKEFDLVVKSLEAKTKQKISPERILVIGDTWEKDIDGAKQINAHYFQVPEYRLPCDSFDLSKILTERFG
jgi:FMN phosphatase YigB (HAD superfamily)